jgi:predicted  nucleic acid-binding Zn-ribbon protein
MALYRSVENYKPFRRPGKSAVMIAGRVSPACERRNASQPEKRSCEMVESLASGTMAGAGSFRCQRCGYVLTLAASDTLSDCPGCGGASFVRASLFSAGRPGLESGEGAVEGGAWISEDAAEQAAVWLAGVRERIVQPGEYLAYQEDGETRVMALTHEWTRVGRSLAADIRFDDPTVSRRHALLVRQPDGVRVLDDRSLNGVFVNGERIEWRMLEDGDEIVVGRYRLCFIDLPKQSAHRREPESTRGIGATG